jgi:tetratricopeptide (TPR) repeat protein
MGIVDRRRGDSQAAVERFTQALAQYEQLENVYGQATSHNLIANGYFMRDDWARADFHYRRSLDLFTQIGDAYNQVLVNNNLGGIALKQGRLEAALGYYQRAVRLLEQIGGSVWVRGALHMNIGHVHIRRGEPEAAADLLGLAESEFERAHVRDLLPELYGLLAEAAWQRGDLPASLDHGQRSVALARELKMPREEGHTLRVLGDIARAQRQFDQARAYLDESYQVLARAHDEYASAQSQLSLARLYAAWGQKEAALELLAHCEAVFERLAAGLDLDHARQLRQELGTGVAG